jgi:uncharacterized membrane protein YedE/YeeE
MSVESTAEVREDVQEERKESLWVYLLLGAFLGMIFIKSEVASWFRIQEMFHFRSVHMYGIIGGAVAVGAVSLIVMKRFGVRTVRGGEIHYPGGEEKEPRRQHILGGICFGLGWGLVGACPGPLFALVGSGIPVMVVGLFGALAGAWFYGLMRPGLPH